MKLLFKNSLLRCFSLVMVLGLLATLSACGGGNGPPGKPVGPGTTYSNN
jgi:hypothetical protein